MQKFEFIIYVKDQNKSKNFYKSVLKLDPVLNVPGMTEFQINDFCKLGIMPENGIASFASAHIAGAGAFDPANALQSIAEQNWLGLYCQGIEAWTEQRRTGFPVLPLPIEAVESEIPSRYSYPAIEQSVNATNYDAAVAAQGPDELTTKPWWLQ